MILCCGEALIDMLPRQSAAGEAAFVPLPGGAVYNTALALGRLGVQAGLWCGLSDDLFGQMLAAPLAEAGVDIALCPRSDRPTTLAFVTLDQGQARYRFYDEGTAARMVGPEALPDLPPDITALYFGGISLIPEPCGSAHEALLLREAGRRLVMMDPNIRPGFVTDAAAYRARLGRMLARADIVKLSDEDLHWLMGPGAAGDHARTLMARGPAVVIVTAGAAGATAWCGDAVVAVTPPPVAVVDTVGAGDTFNAGVLAALARAGALSRAGLRALGPEGLRAALDHGARVAAVTVGRAGANPPWAHELPQ